MRGKLEKIFRTLKLFWKWTYSELSWEDHKHTETNKYTERNKNILRSKRKEFKVPPDFFSEESAENYANFLREHAETVAVHANAKRPNKLKDAYENGDKWLVEAVDIFDLHDANGGVYFTPWKTDAEVEEMFAIQFKGPEKILNKHTIDKAVSVIDVVKSYETKQTWEISARAWEIGLRKAVLDQDELPSKHHLVIKPKAK